MLFVLPAAVFSTMARSSAARGTATGLVCVSGSVATMTVRHTASSFASEAAEAAEAAEASDDSSEAAEAVDTVDAADAEEVHVEAAVGEASERVKSQVQDFRPTCVSDGRTRTSDTCLSSLWSSSSFTVLVRITACEAQHSFMEQSSSFVGSASKRAPWDVSIHLRMALMELWCDERSM